MKKEIIELQDIPRGSQIEITLTSGKKCFATFHHLDGLYSYCTLQDGDPDNVFHLSRFTPLEKVENYYIII